jgi:hypothetical protein
MLRSNKDHISLENKKQFLTQPSSKHKLSIIARENLFSGGLVPAIVNSKHIYGLGNLVILSPRAIVLTGNSCQRRA